MIRAVAFYKSESTGGLVYLPSTMTWEGGNPIATHINITPEPSGANWPCQ